MTVPQYQLDVYYRDQLYLIRTHYASELIVALRNITAWADVIVATHDITTDVPMVIVLNYEGGPVYVRRKRYLPPTKMS